MSWNKEFFNNFYQELFMNRDKEQIIFDVSLIEKITGIRNGSICDFCCGIGDILNEFKNKGYDTYGVDFSKEYIEKSQKLYKNENVIEGDALEINFNKEFDLTINWFSSFGYFDDKKNEDLLKNIYKHTKENGKFVLEIYNTYKVIKNYKEELEYVKEYEGNNVYIKRKSEIDVINKKLIQKWTFEHMRKTTKYETINCYYFLDEIIEKMMKVGFKDIRVYERPIKNLELKEATLDSDRLIFVGTK